MQITLVAFGIARDILDTHSRSMEIPADTNISQLKDRLITEYPAFDKLSNLSFAINEEYQDDQYIINPNDEVVVIPPVSGG